MYLFSNCLVVVLTVVLVESNVELLFKITCKDLMSSTSFGLSYSQLRSWTGKLGFDGFLDGVAVATKVGVQLLAGTFTMNQMRNYTRVDICEPFGDSILAYTTITIAFLLFPAIFHALLNSFVWGEGVNLKTAKNAYTWMAQCYSRKYARMEPSNDSPMSEKAFLLDAPADPREEKIFRVPWKLLIHGFWKSKKSVEEPLSRDLEGRSDEDQVMEPVTSLTMDTSDFEKRGKDQEIDTVTSEGSSMVLFQSSLARRATSSATGASSLENEEPLQEIDIA